MSRRSRPSRHVRGAERARVDAAIGASLARLTRLCARLVEHGLRTAARALHTRPAIVRRLLLGRPVSARAAARVLSRI